MRLEEHLAAGLQAAATHQFSIRIGLYGVRIASTTKALQARLAQKFADLREGPQAGVLAYTFYIAEHAGLTYFWADPARARSYPTHIDDVELVTFFADNAILYELLTTRGVLGFHAAVIAHKGSAGAILGNTTAGKTTTLACARRGLALYSDERCLLENDLVWPFLRAINLRPGGREFLEADGLDDAFARLMALWPHDLEVNAQPSSLPFLLGRDPIALRRVYLIEGFAPHPELTEVTLATALPFLMRSAMSADGRFDRLARLLHDLRSVAVAKLSIGAPDATAQLIEGDLARFHG